jgi:hypothetical protein
VGAGLGGRFGKGGLELGRVPEAVAVGHGEPQTAVGIDLVEFEVVAVEPWMAPVDIFSLMSVIPRRRIVVEWVISPQKRFDFEVRPFSQTCLAN